MHQAPVYYSATLKFRSVSVHLLRGCIEGLYFLWDTYGQFWSPKQCCFDGNILHCLFVAISKLQRERLRQSCAAAFSLNGQKRRYFLLAKSWVLSLLHCHCFLNIVHTECDEWQTSFTLWKFLNSQKSWENWACANSVNTLSLLHPCMRACECG